MDTAGHEAAEPHPSVPQEEGVAGHHGEAHADAEYDEGDATATDDLEMEGAGAGDNDEERDEEEEAASTADVDMDADEEDDEEMTDDEEEEDEEEEEEEQQIEVYPLPPLPPVHAPPKVHGIATTEVYSIIRELRRQMDDPVERERARSMLQGDTDVLLAVAQVLQEAHLLRRSTVNEHGEVEEQLVRQPEAPRPSLPTGHNSWIVETPANVRR
ncbi:hypothetical protein ABB37_09556 [Leptomonas pyrrhocoris]|uniref:Uncharacterized protein n=1 Tax=Leptomonas pyrrhocoris TaxID=157538 RepID=A0A0N0DR57_LEPPY|nr:hypothetical protein ABB37_09556 [Leptomonas pyrrhocoris]XP_015652424.1 hypothetical protein ABB37_09556 [Leptomonas pyrrhocoris]KPA73984.1 hypothetical protein ABB37_09556 [Leptomonas pyrrhocoris]KPA73985.1 hypothetical protein ABB37_09556 [Leptomonas pyrrhocoris]|eukprot:XP_015652423.1 hypothetical protein ABB37_09556 [Leptomonas pyrrhocoris]